MINKRPPIPVELKRKILVEAGHRCAIPTCRATNVEIAHIEEWSKTKKHEYENLIALCPNCHTRFDRGEIDKKSMYMYKDNLRFFIDKYSKFELNILLELANLPPDTGLPFLSILSLLVKSILDEDFVQIIPQPGSGAIVMFGVRMNPDLLTITEKGKQFVENFKNKGIGYNN